MECKKCAWWNWEEDSGFKKCRQASRDYGGTKVMGDVDANGLLGLWTAGFFGCTNARLAFRVLTERTLQKVEKTKTKYGDNDLLVFTTDDDRVYEMYHDQGCCEDVWIEDIVGDLDDLLDSPVLRASEDMNTPDPGAIKGKDGGSHTWTFYNIATAKGHVTLRWYGTSNGYYSESVTFKKVGE